MTFAAAEDVRMQRSANRPRLELPAGTVASLDVASPVRAKAASFSERVRCVEDAGLESIANRLLFQISETRGLILTVDELSRKPEQISRVLSAISQLEDSNRQKLAETVPRGE